MTYKAPRKERVSRNHVISVQLAEPSHTKLLKLASKCNLSMVALVRDMIDHCLTEEESNDQDTKKD